MSDWKTLLERAEVRIAELEARTLTGLMRAIRADNERWWIDLDTEHPVERNVGEMIALMHSELSEALEGHRKSLMDDHLPHRQMFAVELADCIIRILDTAAHLCPDFEAILLEKLAYNRKRADHKIENRRMANGKKY